MWSKLHAARSSSASVPTPDIAQQKHNELMAYTAEAPIDHGKCPLSWWSTNKDKYPTVAAVARRLLAVPAMSVVSERLFQKQEM